MKMPVRVRSVVCRRIDGSQVEVQAHTVKPRLSVYGFLVIDGSMLLMRLPLVAFLFPPGGKVEIGETVCGALVREFSEEVGILVDVGQCVAATENLFFCDSDRQAYRCSLLFYEVRLPHGHAPGRPVPSPGSSVEGHGLWVPLEEIGCHNVRPEFLKAIEYYLS